MQQNQVSDPWNSMENPEIRQPSYHGEVKIDTFYAVLVKGVGKVPFDPQQHSVDQRVTAIDISILPIVEQNISYPVVRNMIAESKEWAGIVLPSIKALGISARELNGKWVLARTKLTGATYVNKQGETKEKSTLEFVKLFKDQAACVADYQNSAPVEDDPTAAVNTPTQFTGSDDKDKATALQFLKAVVSNACRGQSDLKVIQDTITLNVAGMPLINKFFTADSPETIQLVMEYMKKEVQAP